MTLSFVAYDDRKKFWPLDPDKAACEELSDVLKEYFTGNDPIPEADMERALNIFDRMKSEKLLLRCDCHKGQADQGFLSPVWPCSLRRMPLPNTKHDEDCRFKDRSASTSREIIPSARRPSNDHVAVFGPYATPQEGSLHRDRSSSAGSDLPKISQTLFRILEAAKINQYPLIREDTPHSVRAYREAKKLELGPGVPLQPHLVTGGESYSDGLKYIRSLKRKIASPEKWPAGFRPQGYFCGVAETYQKVEGKDYFELRVARWKSGEFIDTRPHTFGGTGPIEKRKPFIAIAGYALPSQGSEIAHGLRCFMQPCVSVDNWMPVDSDLERQTFAVLAMIQKDIPSLRINITKPLFAVEVSHPRSRAILRCKPDFVLEFVRDGKPKKVAIETMGMVSEDYENSKRRTHPIMMLKYGGLIQHNFKRGENYFLKKAFERELKEFLFEAKQPAYDSIQAVLD